MDTLALDPQKCWPAKTLKHDALLTRSRFSPCGRFVVAGSIDRGVYRWDLETEQKATLAGHAGWIGDLAFHPAVEAARLFTADYAGTVLCWPYAAEAPRPLWTIKQAHEGWIRALSVGPDGKLLATAGNDRTVRLWSTETGKPVKELPGHKGIIFSTLFHPDGKTLVSGDLFGVVKQWDVASGKLVRELDAGLLHTRKEDFLADVGGVRGLAFDPKGTQLACSGLTDAESNTFCPGTPAVLVFDWATGKAGPPLRVKEKADGFVNGILFLGDGTLAGYGEGQSGAGLSFWKPGQPEAFHSVRGASGYDLDAHPDGLRLAVAHFEARGQGGNGRKAKKGEYVSNTGSVKIFALYPQPGKKV